MPEPANPKDPVGWFNSAVEYSRDQDYTNALRCYTKATELNPDFIDAWARMGLLLVKLGRFDEAHACDARIRELNKRVAGESRRLFAATETSDPLNRIAVPKKQAKDIWAAGAASAVCPGLGQVYNGEGYKKGWLIMAALFLAALTGAFLHHYEETYWLSPLSPLLSARLFPLLLPVLVWIYSISDAVTVASRINRTGASVPVVTPGSLFAYAVITWAVTGLMILYYPLIDSSLFGLLPQAAPLQTPTG